MNRPPEAPAPEAQRGRQGLQGEQDEQQAEAARADEGVVGHVLAVPEELRVPDAGHPEDAERQHGGANSALSPVARGCDTQPMSRMYPDETSPMTVRPAAPRP
ncbi:MAG: hypothetical protein M3Z75_21785 [Actinomycetota bacterium]|nr:hypothetical protein [Actinomycetota bacterium]